MMGQIQTIDKAAVVAEICDLSNNDIASIAKGRWRKKGGKKTQTSTQQPARPLKLFEQLQQGKVLQTSDIKEKMLDQQDRPVFGPLSSTSYQATVSESIDDIAIAVNKCMQDTTITQYTQDSKKPLKTWPGFSIPKIDLPGLKLTPTSTCDKRKSVQFKSAAAKTQVLTCGSIILTPEYINAFESLGCLINRYSQVSHMGMLDRSYNYFITAKGDGALCFKIKMNVCLVSGDPLCAPELFTTILEEFAEYRKQFHFGIAFIGASDEFAAYSKAKGWAGMQFGIQRVLNPQNNPVLDEQKSKSIVRRNRQLLKADKESMTLGVYMPFTGKDENLQRKLVTIYEEWRLERNKDPTHLQTFITVYDPFSLPDVMVYVYTMDRSGEPNGFAALRRLGAKRGFHIDPCIAAPGTPRGITDLLLFAVMAYLNAAGCAHLSLGYEPLSEPGSIHGISPSLLAVTTATYRSVLRELPLSGKKAYHDKWYPDESLSGGLHLLFPDGLPGPRVAFAVLKFCNLSLRMLVGRKWVNWVVGLGRKRREKVEREEEVE